MKTLLCMFAVAVAACLNRGSFTAGSNLSRHGGFDELLICRWRCRQPQTCVHIGTTGDAVQQR